MGVFQATFSVSLQCSGSPAGGASSAAAAWPLANGPRNSGQSWPAETGMTGSRAIRQQDRRMTAWRIVGTCRGGCVVGGFQLNRRRGGCTDWSTQATRRRRARAGGRARLGLGLGFWALGLGAWGLGVGRRHATACTGAGASRRPTASQPLAPGRKAYPGLTIAVTTRPWKGRTVGKLRPLPGSVRNMWFPDRRWRFADRRLIAGSPPGTPRRPSPLQHNSLCFLQRPLGGRWPWGVGLGRWTPTRLRPYPGRRPPTPKGVARVLTLPCEGGPGRRRAGPRWRGTLCRSGPGLSAATGRGRSAGRPGPAR